MKTVDQAENQRLPDFCIDLFAFAIRLRQSKTQDNERALRARESGLQLGSLGLYAFERLLGTPRSLTRLP